MRGRRAREVVARRRGVVGLEGSWLVGTVCQIGCISVVRKGEIMARNEGGEEGWKRKIMNLPFDRVNDFFAAENLTESTFPQVFEFGSGQAFSALL